MRIAVCPAIFACVAWVMASPGSCFAMDPRGCPDSVPEDPYEQVVLGNEYVQGENRNYGCAKILLEKAAEAGNREGAFNLGVMYAQGLGVPYDGKEAVRWFTIAAKAGLPEAQYNLGVRHSQGLGVPLDDKKAVHWFAKAAEAGLPDAQYNLGVRYFHGRGEIKDNVEAYKWFNLAAAGGNVEASKARDLITWKMTSEQIAEAQRLSREWRDDNGGSDALAK